MINKLKVVYKLQTINIQTGHPVL